MKKLVLLTIALLVVGSLTASADVVTVTVGGGAAASGDIPIPANLVYAFDGPVSWDNEYTWSSTNLFNNGGSVFGYSGSYGFGANGSWDSSMGPFIGLNDSTAIDGSTDTMTIAFTNPVTKFGDFFNYVPGSGNPTTIDIYDVNGNLLDAYNLTFTTNGNNDSGEWLYFTSTVPIGYFTMSDNYIAMTATPEPSTLAYFLLAAVCGGVMFFVVRPTTA